MKHLILLGLLAIASGTYSGQGKVPVFVSSAVGNDDQTGLQFVSEVKDAIRGSQALRIVDDGKQWPYIKIVISVLV